MKQPVIVTTMLLALLSGVLSPAFSGQSSAAIPTRPHSTSLHTNAPPRAFDKTRFLAHLAVAAFLIHYTYKKYQQGLLIGSLLTAVMKIHRGGCPVLARATQATAATPVVGAAWTTLSSSATA